MTDMKNKKRYNNPYGEKSHYHKFSDAIIAQVKKDQRPYRVLMKVYEMSKGNISMIKNDKTRIKE